ncbi:hypothetical protein HK405_002292 [Cladochytrium tenue]|nr:hypothetical protein HK405_002292 [Cladochytrium tenue]
MPPRRTAPSFHGVALRSLAAAAAIATTLVAFAPALSMSAPDSSSTTPQVAAISTPPDTAVWASLAAYFGLWAAAVVAVYIYTIREAVTIKREAVLLHAELTRLGARWGGHVMAGGTAGTIASASGTGGRNGRAAAGVRGAARGLGIDVSGAAAAGTDDGADEDELADNGILVIPSTPTTTLMLAAVAAGGAVSGGKAAAASCDDVIDCVEDAQGIVGAGAAAAAAAVSSASTGLHAEPSSVPPAAAVSTGSQLTVGRQGQLPRKLSVLDELKKEGQSGPGGRGLTPSIIFVSDEELRPTLLVEAQVTPWPIHLWSRLLRTSRPRFARVSEASFAAGAAERRRFATPLNTTDPTAARVHRLIHAAIEADLAILETRLFRRNGGGGGGGGSGGGQGREATTPRPPAAAFALLGFLLLAAFLALWSAGGAPWSASRALSVLLATVAASLGVLVSVAAAVRQLPAELRAERAVLRLALRRARRRAPYVLEFRSARRRVNMDAWDWACVVPFAGLAVAVAAAAGYSPAWWRASSSAAPPSPSGAASDPLSPDRDEFAGSVPRLFFLTGCVYPPVWHVAAHLRMPKDLHDDSSTDEDEPAESVPGSPVSTHHHRHVALSIIVDE